MAQDPANAPSPDGAVSVILDGQVLVLLDRPVVIGRNPTPGLGERALPISDEHHGVSKTHLRLAWRDGAVRVTDLHSTNGVEIQVGHASRMCEPGVASEAPAGSVIRFGGHEFQVP
jgi:hypothetical protein